MMYWTNWSEEPTIESSFVNGTDRRVIVKDDLIAPFGLSLDVKQQKIYWANNLDFKNYQIERSYVDGSKREVLFEGTGSFIYGLTVYF